MGTMPPTFVDYGMRSPELETASLERRRYPVRILTLSHNLVRGLERQLPVGAGALCLAADEQVAGELLRRGLLIRSRCAFRLLAFLRPLLSRHDRTLGPSQTCFKSAIECPPLQLDPATARHELMGFANERLGHALVGIAMLTHLDFPPAEEVFDERLRRQLAAGRLDLANARPPRGHGESRRGATCRDVECAETEALRIQRHRLRAPPLRRFASGDRPPRRRYALSLCYT